MGLGGVSEDPAWVVVTHAELPNGSAHRLVGALLQAGCEVGLCAMPLPGASRFRSERMLPGVSAVASLVDDPRAVPWRQELRSALDVARFAWRVAREGSKELVIVGCDPVSFLEGLAAFRIAPVRVRTAAAWFVDWSAQRLRWRLTGAPYLGATRVALRLADVVAAISPAAAEALNRVGRPPHEVLVLPNQPLAVGSGPPWTARPLSVAYLGGLSDHQGVEVLLGAARILGEAGVAVDIAGGGPAAAQVAAAAPGLPNLSFHGLVEDVGGLARLLHRSRVGWALYDPHFPMHAYNDPLKIKDYLAAGLRVVSTLPTSADDGIVKVAGYSVAEVVEATRAALSQPPSSKPSEHPLLVEGRQSLQAFVAAVQAAL
jgi:glycosyltransferase involved in cell wall biosynthesis